MSFESGFTRALAVEGKISTLDRTRLLAQVLIPLLTDLREEIGRERAHAIVGKAIAEASRERVRAEAAEIDGTPLEKFRGLMNRSAADNGPQLEIDVLSFSAERVEFDVKRCRYAELFRSLGEPELGEMLLCASDRHVADVGGEAVAFTRSQTLMEGASHCDFRYCLGAANASTDDEP